MKNPTIEEFIQCVHIMQKYAKRHDLDICLHNSTTQQHFIFIENRQGHKRRDLGPEAYTKCSTLRRAKSLFEGGTPSCCKIIATKEFQSWINDSVQTDLVDCLLQMPESMQTKFYTDWSSEGKNFDFDRIWQAHHGNLQWFSQHWKTLAQAINSNWTWLWERSYHTLGSWLEANPEYAPVILNEILPYLDTSKLNPTCLLTTGQFVHDVFQNDEEQLKIYAKSFPFIDKMLQKQGGNELFSQDEKSIECLKINKEDIVLHFHHHRLSVHQYMEAAHKVIAQMKTSNSLLQHGLQDVNAFEHEPNHIKVYFEFSQGKAIRNHDLMTILLDTMDVSLKTPNIWETNVWNDLQINESIIQEVAQACIFSWLMDRNLPKKEESKQFPRKI